jgi:hypothetical protein
LKAMTATLWNEDLRWTPNHVVWDKGSAFGMDPKRGPGLRTRGRSFYARLWMQDVDWAQLLRWSLRQGSPSVSVPK